jgi:galactose mutarotase-like enzyme
VVLSYGGILAEFSGCDGISVVVGFADLAGYVADRRHFGAIAGRFANRIAIWVSA